MSIQEEIWKDIEGFKNYQVSNFGNIRSIFASGNNWSKKRIKAIKPRIGNNSGYYAINLLKDSRRITIRIHRLVAEAFIPNPENKPMVNHKNGIKTDNRIENLEWCTRKENMQHAWDTGLISRKRKRISRLTYEKVLEIREMRNTTGCSIKKISELFGVSQGAVFNIIHNKSWRLKDNGSLENGKKGGRPTIQDKWNAQADKWNQWDNLSDEEKREFKKLVNKKGDK